ncbi:MAG: tRNA (guanosine(37)-N1)-methyltransferase TrmD [Pseudomonadota bacterium]|nr:tRNA (guanosine(37)-N1)-methyltransferase TrmD [Pseudomonadota bacterium]
MNIDVISIFPAMFDALTAGGVTGRAIGSGLLGLRMWNPRDFTVDRHRSVDDRPYGGGPGMVMRPEPVAAAIAAARAENPGARTVYLSPKGRRLDQTGVLELAARGRLILVAGRYEGVDQRVLDIDVDEEWSIGDYVLSGGELAAMVLIDAVARQLPGVLGHGESAQDDSFAAGLLEYEHYTRPEVYAGRAVPAVLLSGDHGQIRRWRLKRALGQTWLRRPDLLERLQLDEEQRRLLDEFRREHGGDAG